ncbi:MFS transporter [Microbacter margulisiae]|uniref:MFS family permease n=1 Tax=Microbacter margulisiae TaxID=1350067 RepID=A0A7W5DT45_9PORP|nr:MFS transporter [Microbacter margulisiae]MBB3188280.1 MFS family permease [Microbacter margulisiae]
MPTLRYSAFTKNKSLVIFLIVRVFSTFVFQMTSVAIGWQMYSITHSAFDLGLVGLVQFIPMVLFTLIVGMVADRFNRKLIICISQAVLAAAFIFLSISSHMGWVNREWILGIVFFLGTANAFQGPAIRSLLPNIVSKESFTQATAGVSSLTQVATIVGPALGGILYLLSPSVVYLISGSFALISTIIVLFIKVSQNREQREPVTAKSLVMGISFIKERPTILGAISLDLFAVLFGGATALLPIYASSILKTGSLGLGMLRSAPAVGAMLVSLYLARHPIRRAVGRSMFAAVVVFGIATLIFAVSRIFVLSLAALVVLGAADVISVVIRSTLVQLGTPDAMRGRVNSITQLFIGTSNQLGEFESGVTASWFGVVPAAILGGVGTIAVVLAWVKLFPSLYREDAFQYDGR